MKMKTWRPVHEIILELANNLRKYVQVVQKHKEPKVASSKETIQDSYHTQIIYGSVITDPNDYEMYKL